MKHILIDFENVQPEASQLSGVDDEKCHIWLFLGKLQQNTLSGELCEALCRFGKNVHFVRVAKTGKNALDFYLAYYLGKITEQDKEALICILSRDGGFDVLVEHLEDTHLCKGIIRLGSLEDAGKNEELLLEMRKKDEETAIVDPLHSTLLTACFKKASQHLINCQKDSNLILNTPKAMQDLEQYLLSSVLQVDLQHLDKEQQQKIIKAVVEHMINKELITLNPVNNHLQFHFSQDELLATLLQHVERSKPKTVCALQNVLRTKANSIGLNSEDNDLKQMIRYCATQKILKVKGEKVEYLSQDEIKKEVLKTNGGVVKKFIVSQKEDLRIMQEVQAFFERRQKNRPASRKTLTNAFKSALKLEDGHIEMLIDRLAKQGKLFTVSESGKIIYK